MPFFDDNEFLWERLKNTDKPIVVYGTGNGADKLFSLCERFGVTVSAIFASDGFVRSREFRGFRVQSLSDIERQYKDFIVLLSFAVFKDDLIQTMINISKKHEFYAPDMPLFGGGLLDRQLLTENADKIANAYSLLADDRSRAVFENVLRYRYTGRIDYLLACESSRDEIMSGLSLPKNPNYLDLGAYDGDTVREFIARYPDHGEITALEPDPKNFKKMKKDAELVNRGVNMIEAAAWCKSGALEFSAEGSRNSHAQSDGSIVRAVSVDELLENRRVDLIKMDVEGAESEVLFGMKNTACKWSPALIVSAYHKTNDLFELIEKVAKLLPERNIYLRHHRYIPAWETNIYAF